MKKIGFFILFLMIVYGTVFPDLTLIQPKGGEILVRGSVYLIIWSAPASEGEQKVDIYLGEVLIADTSKKKDGFFNWTVGRLKNGSMVPPGHYTIVLESLDGDAFGGKFSISMVIPPHPLLVKIRKLDIFPYPDAGPMCFNVDLRKIKSLIKSPGKQFQLKLYSNNRLAAHLGQFGGGSSLPDFAKIEIPSQAGVLPGKTPGLKYELKLFDSQGELVESQEVTLVISTKR